MREKLVSDLKAAMKGGDKRRVETIRLINAALKDRDIEARASGHVVGDTEIMSLLQKMVKTRRESQDIFVKAGRDDLALREGEEIAIIEDYLPQQMGETDMAKTVDAAIAKANATSIKDMGKVVNSLKADYAGQMDFAKASVIVKSRLTSQT